MKQYTNIALILISSCILLGCGVDQSEYDKVKKERDKFELTIKQQDTIIQHLRDTVSMLSYPASQRFIKINGLVSEGKYEKHKMSCNNFLRFFRNQKKHNLFHPFRLR